MIIAHRCRTCRHTDLGHQRGACDARYSRSCDCPALDPGPSEIIPSFTDGRLNERVLTPGSCFQYALGDACALRLCDCEECWNVYETPDAQ